MTLTVGRTSCERARAAEQHLVSPDVRLRHIGRCLHAADHDAAGALQVHCQSLARQQCRERLVVCQTLGLQMAGHPVRIRVSQQWRHCTCCLCMHLMETRFCPRMGYVTTGFQAMC